MESALSEFTTKVTIRYETCNELSLALLIKEKANTKITPILSNHNYNINIPHDAMYHRVIK